MELAALEGLKILFPHVFDHFNSDCLILEDKQNGHNILCLNLGLIAASSSELPALEMSFVKYGVSKHYVGSQISDRCPF